MLGNLVTFDSWKLKDDFTYFLHHSTPGNQYLSESGILIHTEYTCHEHQSATLLASNHSHQFQKYVM